MRPWCQQHGQFLCVIILFRRACAQSRQTYRLSRKSTGFACTKLDSRSGSNTLNQGDLCEIVPCDLLHLSRKLQYSNLTRYHRHHPRHEVHTLLRRPMKTRKSDHTSSCTAGFCRNSSTHLSTAGELVSTAAKVRPCRCTCQPKQSPCKRWQGPAHLSRRFLSLSTMKTELAVFTSLLHSMRALHPCLTSATVSRMPQG